MLDFEGTVVAVETNIPEIAEFAIESHRAMVAANYAKPAAIVRVWKNRKSYSIAGRRYKLDMPVSSFFPMFKDQILNAFVNVRSDLLWLHAGAVSRGDSAVLIVAPSGQGKSTIVTFLCKQGWHYMSDEAAPIDLNSLNVHPWPRTPVRRLYPGRKLAKEEMGAVERERWNVPDNEIRRSIARIEAMVLPSFEHGSQVTLNRMSAGEASMALVRNAINFHDHRQEAVSTLTHLGQQVPAFRLTYEDGLKAALRVDTELSFTFKDWRPKE